MKNLNQNRYKIWTDFQMQRLKAARLKGYKGSDSVAEFLNWEHEEWLRKNQYRLDAIKQYLDQKREA